MITGVVNARREAVIEVDVCDASGQTHRFEAVVDTGFNGSLTLPQGSVTALGLTWRNRGRVTLANGSEAWERPQALP